MSGYFNKIPTISYNNSIAKNLMARAALTAQTLNNRTLFLPYTINDTVRPDVISYKYYDDSDYTWLIYMTNNVVDPYYGVYISDDDFEKFIIDKYGSIQSAYNKIMFYRISWVDWEDQLSPEAWETLPGFAKKYYDPVIDSNNNIFHYERKHEEWVVSTNRMIQLDLSSVDGAFIPGEKVIQNYLANSHNQANAHVQNIVSSTAMFVQHVEGEFQFSNTSQTLVVTGVDSGASAYVDYCNFGPVDDTGKYLWQNITDDEYVYWAPVTAYDYENELNTQRKEIVMIDKRYASQVESELRKVMSQ